MLPDRMRRRCSDIVPPSHIQLVVPRGVVRVTSSGVRRVASHSTMVVMHRSSDSTVSPLSMYRPIRLTSELYRATKERPVGRLKLPPRSDPSGPGSGGG